MTTLRELDSFPGTKPSLSFVPHGLSYTNRGSDPIFKNLCTLQIQGIRLPIGLEVIIHGGMYLLHLRHGHTSKTRQINNAGNRHSDQCFQQPTLSSPNPTEALWSPCPSHLPPVRCCPYPNSSTVPTVAFRAESQPSQPKSQ